MHSETREAERRFSPELSRQARAQLFVPIAQARTCSESNRSSPLRATSNCGGRRNLRRRVVLNCCDSWFACVNLRLL